MVVSRSIVSVLMRWLGDFSLHPQGRPCGRPPAAAVLGRQRHDGNRGTALTLHPEQGGSITGQAMSFSPPEEVHAMTSQGTAARMPRWGRLPTRARPGPG
jgi:hypothetical protein